MQNHFLARTLAFSRVLTETESFLHVSFDRAALLETARVHALKDFPLPKWDMPGVEPLDDRAFPSHCF